MRYPSPANQLKKGEISVKQLTGNKDEVDATKKGGAITVKLTNEEREEIEKLLQDIDDELIRGAFYSI